MASAPRLSLIVCTQPRSGSYLLGDLLGLATDVPELEEWLIPTFQVPEATRFRMPDDFDRLAYVRELVSQKTSAKGVFSIKIMGWNFAEFIAEMQQRSEFAGSSKREILEALFPNPHFLFLRRSNHLSQAVSYAKAIQTQQWRAEHEKRRPTGHVSYSTLFVRDQFVAINKSEERWKTFFTQSDLKPYELIYEDFLKEPLQTLGKICEWLNLSPTSNLPVVEKRLNEGRQSSVTNAEWKKRFAAEETSLKERTEPPVRFQAGTLTLSVEKPALSIEAFKADKLEVVITNQSTQSWKGGEAAYNQDEGWLVVAGSLPSEDGVIDYRPYVFQEVPFPLQPGESMALELFFPARSKSGVYPFNIALEQHQDGRWQSISAPTEVRLEVRKTVKLIEAEGVFPSLEELTANQCRVPGLGIFSHRNFPWIHHQQHGWMFIDVKGSSAHEIWLHDEVLKWLSFDPDQPGQFFDYERKETIRFVDCQDGERHFYNLASCKQETYPLQKISAHVPDSTLAGN
jgi:LPS sulfotransferase NodH